MTDKTPNEQLVLDFFNGMGPDLDSFKETYRKYLAEDVIWETVGFEPHVGLKASLDYLDDLEARTGMTHCDEEVLVIASSGDIVFTERIDIMLRPDGTKIVELRAVGVLEVRDGKIHRYSDYLDTFGTAAQIQAL